MSLGQKIKVRIPPEKAYGKEGVFGRIPPNTPLNIEVELLTIS
jgi:FKBP-type peptidyl-prolyl cis-trans isomerase